MLNPSGLLGRLAHRGFRECAVGPLVDQAVTLIGPRQPEVPHAVEARGPLEERLIGKVGGELDGTIVPAERPIALRVAEIV